MDKTIGEYTLKELVDIATKANNCDDCPLFSFCEINYGEITCFTELCNLDKEIEVNE